MWRCPTCQTPYGAELLLCPADGTPLGDGTLEGRYRVHRLIGHGGMGVVYLGEHIALKKRVAIKLLKGDMSRDPMLARRFELEAIAASRIGHENIVDVTDFGRTSEGALYLVMEYLEGQTLSAALRASTRLELPRALDVLAQIADALEAAHAHGIVHRDLKPQNVMLLRRRDGGDTVKLLDFGVSKVTTEAPERITQQGALLGTAEYMAPEQVNGDTDVDARADIYAFGVVAYELVTGSLPFSAAGTLNMLLKHLNEAPEPPSRRAPGLPPALEQLILRAMSKKPEERPQTMGEVRAALNAVRDSLAAQAREPHPAAPEPPRSSQPALATPRPAHAAPAQAASPHDTLASGSREVPVALPATTPSRPRPLTDALRPEELALVRRPRWPAALGIGLGMLVALAAAAALVSRSTPSATPPSPAPTVAAAPPSVTAAEPPRLATATPDVAAPPVTLRSNPPGASVYRGDQLLGQTPVELRDPAGELRVTLEGYKPERVRIPPGQASVDVTLTKAPPRTRSSTRPANKAGAYNKVEDLKSSPY